MKEKVYRSVHMAFPTWPSYIAVVLKTRTGTLPGTLPKQKNNRKKKVNHVLQLMKECFIYQIFVATNSSVSVGDIKL